MNSPRAHKGLSGFVLDKEKICRFKDWPASRKLEWLEAANNFLLLALDDKRRGIWERFRRGEI